eukprot:TCONS_00055774-protein
MDDLVVHIVSVIVGFMTVLGLVILLAPRYIFLLSTRWKTWWSSFGGKKFIKVEKNVWACYCERNQLKNTNASILLLHGFAGSTFDFVPFVEKLPKNLHIIALDLLNHGESSTITDRDVTVTDMARFVKKFVEKVDLHRRKFHLVSFSYSTTVACQYTSNYSDDVASLVLCAPPHILNKVQPEDMIFGCNKDYLSYLDHQANGKLTHPSPFIIRAKIDFENKKATGYISVARGQMSFAFSKDLLNSIKTKCLMVWGDQDKICLTKGLDHFKEHFDGCESVLVADCGHLLFQTNVNEVSSAIIAWVTKQQKEHSIPHSQGLKPSMR